jgi:hypothetical protein
MVFSEGSGDICRIFEWLEALVRKNRALQSLNFFLVFLVYCWGVWSG